MVFNNTAGEGQALRGKLLEHKEYVRKHGDDMPEIANWRWGGEAAASGPETSADNV